MPIVPAIPLPLTQNRRQPRPVTSTAAGTNAARVGKGSSQQTPSPVIVNGTNRDRSKGAAVDKLSAQIDSDATHVHGPGLSVNQDASSTYPAFYAQDTPKETLFVPKLTRLQRIIRPTRRILPEAITPTSSLPLFTPPMARPLHRRMDPVAFTNCHPTTTPRIPLTHVKTAGALSLVAILSPTTTLLPFIDPTGMFRNIRPPCQPT